MPEPSAYFRGESGDHWCDVRHRGHYDPCGCACEPCTKAREKPDG